jgi:hypothetical protein
MNKKATKINKRKIKIRKTWTRNPKEQVTPNKKHEPEPFNGRGFNGITEEDLDYYDEFERGFHD